MLELNQRANSWRWWENGSQNLSARDCIFLLTTRSSTSFWLSVYLIGNLTLLLRDHMDIGPIGSHCAKTLCNDLDFLPIKCTHCSSTFCRHHISPPAHDCTAVDKKVGDSPSDWVSRTKCAVEGCDKPSLDSAFTTDRVEDEIDAVGGARRNGVTCSDCGSAYCVM